MSLARARQLAQELLDELGALDAPKAPRRRRSPMREPKPIPGVVPNQLQRAKATRLLRRKGLIDG